MQLRKYHIKVEICIAGHKVTEEMEKTVGMVENSPKEKNRIKNSNEEGENYKNNKNVITSVVVRSLSHTQLFVTTWTVLV